MTRALRPDALVVALLVTAMAATSWSRSAMLHDAIYQYFSGPMRTTDVWFDADIPRSMCMATERLASQHGATSDHPLLSTLFFVPTQVVIGATGLPAVEAVRGVVAAGAGLWIATFYWLLRLLRLRIIDAAVFALLAASTAAAVFWTAVPESFVLGAISIMLPAIVICRAEPISDTRLVVAGALSLGVTLTNWWSGVLMVLLTRRPRAALQVCVNTLVLVALLGALQLAWFPRAELFPGNGRALDNLSNTHWPRADAVLTAFVMHSVVLPPVVAERQQDPPSVVLTVPPVSAWSGGAARLAAIAAWGGLLALGAIALGRGVAPPVFRVWLVAMLAGQFLLHLVFGRETFLYAMHFAPLLVLVAACAALGTQRRAALGVAVAAIVLLNVINHARFDAATALLREIGGEAARHGAVFGPPFDCSS